MGTAWCSMSISYIDVSEIGVYSAGAYISRIAGAENPMLVFMPNLNYAGMHEAEEMAASFNIGMLNIPITLPMLDLVRQMEFAGVHMSQKLICGLEKAFRSAIITQLTEEGECVEREGDHPGQNQS